MTRSAITGVTGFIGSHLAEVLVDRGEAPVGVCRETSSLANLAGVDIELRRAHLLDTEALQEAFAGCGCVYHVAGVTKSFSDEEMWRGNVEGTACVARAAIAAGVKRLVLVSSGAAAGPGTVEAPMREAQRPSPVSRYGRSKRSAELEAWRRAADIELVIVRPPAVYGPRDYDVLENMKVSKRGLVFKTGFDADRVFSVIQVRDLVRALILTADSDDRVVPGEDPEQPSGSGIFHVDDGAPVTWTDWSALQARLLGRSARVVPLPFWLLRGIAAGSQAMGMLRGKAPIFSPDKVREAQQAGWVLGCQRAGEVLGYFPEVDLERGTQETIDWYRTRGLL